MVIPSRRIQVFLSCSGGKDSALALHALRREPSIEVVGLLTSVTRGYDRISVHGVRRALLEAQVKVLGLPLVEISLDPTCSNDAYGAAFQDALRTIKRDWPDVSGIAFGDCFSKTYGLIASVHWRAADSILFSLFGASTPLDWLDSSSRMDTLHASFALTPLNSTLHLRGVCSTRTFLLISRRR
jgi:hypothetical protein